MNNDMQEMESDIFRGESREYLTNQIITYLGNKRTLLGFIGTAINKVCDDLGKDKIDIADVFSGSGVVSRYFKQYAHTLYVNDLEDYCQTINRCYLSNREDIDGKVLESYFRTIHQKVNENGLKAGFITEMYSPKDDNNIKKGERVFFTTRNAMYIDTVRQLIDEVDENYRPFLLAPLLYEASVHNNTSGVFKGFYKNTETGVGQYGGDGRNALSRILADIEIKEPVFSNYSCDVRFYQEDANNLAKIMPQVDLAYMDPPYNQHPYGSNYFMLNLINNYVRPVSVSRVSGIPKDWNKSSYNKKSLAKESMRELCADIKAKYLLISFSDDGFISKEEMVDMLTVLGEVDVLDRQHNTFRGSRNLNSRDIHVKEYLYLVKKK